MRILTTQNTVQTSSFVRALFGHVPKLLAVTTFYRGIEFNVVPCHLVLHLRKHVVIHTVLVVVASFLHSVE